MSAFGGPAPLRSQLGRLVSPNPLSPQEYDALRARAWAERAIVVVAVTEIADPWLKQALVNEATRRWGRRMKR